MNGAGRVIQPIVWSGRGMRGPGGRLIARERYSRAGAPEVRIVTS
jgi:hypothetical protein